MLTKYTGVIMAILSVNPTLAASQVGLVGVNPSIRYILTDDTLATVTTTGYLTSYQATYQFESSEMALVYTTDQGDVWANLDISGDVISLVVATGNVELPTTANHIAVYSDATGDLTQDVAIAINDGDIQAGVSASAGKFISYPPVANKGKMVFEAVDAVGDYTTTVNNNSDLQQTTVYTLGDAVSADQTIMTTRATSIGNCAALKTYDVTFTFSDLALGGALGIVQGGGYRVRNMWLNSGGTNFSGGGGNRLIQVSDGTAAYTVIPAAIAQAAVNLVWGTATDMPFPASVAIDRQTTGSLFIAYSGGTTDYTAGSLTLTLLLEKVT